MIVFNWRFFSWRGEGGYEEKTVSEVRHLHGTIWRTCTIFERELKPNLQSISSPSINFLTVSHHIIWRLICFVLWVSRCFIKESAILVFLYCFGFNLKKKNLVENVNIYNQQLNSWWYNWCLHNWRKRSARLKRHKNRVM